MTTRDKAYEWIDAHKDDMVDLWKQMVTIDSGIGVKEGGMEMGNLCAGILEKLGFSIRRVSYEKCGDTIIGERGDLSKPYTIQSPYVLVAFCMPCPRTDNTNSQNSGTAFASGKYGFAPYPI